MSTSRKRPLSPHLEIYRMPWAAGLMSITHRLTGAALAVGTVLLVYWLMMAAGGKESYEQAQAILKSPVALILLFGWTVALYYHLCNGIRHLFWDAGYGFDLPAARQTGLMVIIGTTCLTVVTWILVFLR